MRKGTFILILSLFFINCKEKTKAIEKTYEQLEAEVLSDVLPEIAIDYYELFHFYKFPPPPPDINSKKFSEKEINSIKEKSDSLLKNYYKTNQLTKDSIVRLIPEFKKVNFGIVDTIWGISKKAIFSSKYNFKTLKDSLGNRLIKTNEFKNSSLNIIITSLDSVFEGDIKNNPNVPLVALSRVLIDKNRKSAYFEVYRYFLSEKIYCVYSQDKNKWIIKEKITDNNL